MPRTPRVELPDDDEPMPRYRPAIDEVQAAHDAAGEYLPPLGPVLASPAITPPPPLAPLPLAPAPLAPPPPLALSPAPTQPVQSTPVSPTIPSTNTAVLGYNFVPGAPATSQQTVQLTGLDAAAAAQASVGLAQASIDSAIVNSDLKKEDEHWIKAYWRPAMGWLYMIICFMDFVGFPLISMFLPVVFRKDGINAPYVAWQSLTLSNGGLIHLAFGAILGVAAWSRGTEKIAAMK